MMESPQVIHQEELRHCICLRPRGLVMCRVCGWTCPKARAKKLCVVHPKTMYLMDLEMCPMCMANAILLVEYKEED